MGFMENKCLIASEGGGRGLGVAGVGGYRIWGSWKIKRKRISASSTQTMIAE
jgi:hypothetical protein